MTKSNPQRSFENPMDEIYAIRRDIVAEYGPDIRSISRKISEEQCGWHDFDFVDMPPIRHRGSLELPLFASEEGAEYDAHPLV